MTIAILATVVSALELLRGSEVMGMLDHDLAQGVTKVHHGVRALHDKLHHKNKQK